MHIDFTKIKDAFLATFETVVGPCIASGILTFSIWWFNTENRLSFSSIISFLVGGCICYLLYTLIKAVRWADRNW